MQMIGSDFDGTIVQRKTISKKTREQIEAFRKRGNQFVIVSGRTVTKMKEGLKKYEADFYDAIIACNGAAILDGNLNWIEEQTMDEETVKMLLRDLAAYDPVADGGRAVSFAHCPDEVQAHAHTIHTKIEDVLEDILHIQS